MTSSDTEKRALCSHDDPELWFPNKTSRDLEAVRICGLCPIQESCLEFALDHDIEFGIWGGKTEDERAKLMADRPRSPEQADKESPLPGHGKRSEVNGVIWNRWRSHWVVNIRTKDDQRHYGGGHTDKEKAEAKARAMHRKLRTDPVRRRGGRK